VADKHGLRSVAFPAISTGVFGYPIDKCARIMLSTALAYLKQPDTLVETVVFCLYGQRAFDVFAAELGRQRGTR
jgi:O-acetyl-ADP-ribose deacetylase (regulator of RNase III)